MEPSRPFLSPRALRTSWFAAAAATLATLAGCVTPAGREPAAPAPPLQLVSAATLDLPGDCRPPDGVVYRTNFVVGTDGRVSGVTFETGDGCVQDALRRWVSTFQYRPVAESTPVAFDWMLVTASRRG
jgi:hypothetical protein